MSGLNRTIGDEHGKQEVIEPPRWLAVLLVSTGASYIRWLAEMDAWLLARGAREVNDEA